MDPRFGLGGPPVYFGKVGGPPVWWTPGFKKLSSTLTDIMARLYNISSESRKPSSFAWNVFRTLVANLRLPMIFLPLKSAKEMHYTGF